MPILAIRSLTRSLKLKPFEHNLLLCAMGQRDIDITRLNWPWSQFCKTFYMNCKQINLLIPQSLCRTLENAVKSFNSSSLLYSTNGSTRIFMAAKFMVITFHGIAEQTDQQKQNCGHIFHAGAWTVGGL